MKTRLPHEPKPKLLDLLKRRGQTLESWMLDLGLPDHSAVDRYCLEHQLECPPHPRLIVPAPKVAVPAETPAAPTPEISEFAVTEVPGVVAERPNRKTRRQLAAQKQSKEPETTGDSETPSDDN